MENVATVGAELASIYKNKPELCTKQNLWQLLYWIKDTFQRCEDAKNPEELEDFMLHLKCYILAKLSTDASHTIIEDTAPELTHESIKSFCEGLIDIFSALRVATDLCKISCMIDTDAVN